MNERTTRFVAIDRYGQILFPFTILLYNQVDILFTALQFYCQNEKSAQQNVLSRNNESMVCHGRSVKETCCLKSQPSNEALRYLGKIEGLISLYFRSFVTT